MSYLFTAPMKHYTPAEANRSSDPEQSESWRGLVETTFAVAAIVLLAVFALKMAEPAAQLQCLADEPANRGN